MAIPIPLLLVAGALLLGGKKKKKKARPTLEVIPVETAEGATMMRPIEAIPAFPTTKEEGKPWDRCKPPAGSPEGTYSAFDKDGRCRVFWNAHVFKKVKRKLLEEYEKSNKQKVCARDKLEGGVWKTNKHRVALVAKVVKEIWPQIPKNQLPPVEGRSPYFVQMIWALSYGWFSHHVCGLNPVT